MRRPGKMVIGEMVGWLTVFITDVAEGLLSRY
jgi:hypothetical protein